MDNIDDEYERLVECRHDCTRKVKSFKSTKRRLFPKTLELVGQRGAAKAAGRSVGRSCRGETEHSLRSSELRQS
ncbi:hypothetical protein RB195_022921 [Necator americanus]|uniref:Uncharacterized protein n=1 Tax=Necator americanus TaxID=51031 RepID=A0ABR1EH45_NECAM